MPRDRGGDAAITAWRPRIPGISEVFHAHFRHHQYPIHTHTVWTLLILDDGALQYDLDRHRHDTLATITMFAVPVFGTISSVVLLHETINLVQLGGALITIVGALLAVYP